MAVIDTAYLSVKYAEAYVELSAALAQDEPDQKEVLRWWATVESYGSLIKETGSLGGMYTKAQLQKRLDDTNQAFDGILHNLGSFVYEQMIAQNIMKRVLTALVAESD